MMVAHIVFLIIGAVMVLGESILKNREKATQTRFDVPTDINVLLYTRRNPSKPEILRQDVELLGNSSYDVKNPTKIIVHGWKSGIESHVNVVIRQAILEEQQVNFIYFDWEKGANLEYISAVENAPKVGKYLAVFIDWLIEHGTLIDKIHLIGHSIGAHIAGIAGRKVTRATIPYITALDPAGILWGAESERIRQTDAAYVEIIHTETIITGTVDVLGHVDFYPNGGTFMPGCFIDLACSHDRAILYFANSIDHKGFMGIRCSNQSEASNATCIGPDYLHMGGLRPKQMHGIFYLKTSDHEPFYLDPRAYSIKKNKKASTYV